MISLKKRAQGFTIVELLIVIVVIGILAGLVITTYSGVQENARNTERQTDLKAIQGQLEAYYAKNGTYPSATLVNDDTWRHANMKGLDDQALRDPKGAVGSKLLVDTAASATQYGYQGWSDSGKTTACTDSGSGDTATSDCLKYTLTAQKEGSADVISYSSLN